MTAKNVKPTQSPGAPAAPASGGQKATQQCDSGQPGGGQGRVDVTGIVPDNVHVDPNLTQGHPGYEESGDSEIIPGARLARGEAGKDRR